MCRVSWTCDGHAPAGGAGQQGANLIAPPPAAKHKVVHICQTCRIQVQLFLCYLAAYQAHFGYNFENFFLGLLQGLGVRSNIAELSHSVQGSGPQATFSLLSTRGKVKCSPAKFQEVLLDGLPPGDPRWKQG
eukprot:s780_g6.t1